ncbi:hypothetical protein BDN71DRAFT_374884 [Pleurotus eryngii]|uniref:Uncharacterized protein n=1 Tax=Pleurotus eryngii TaxID=5323 RepID=A0A9P6A1X9_PLEER|nr:hypothetical protein BDN71DRAFT_374884 [Pleurotus eryngii]
MEVNERDNYIVVKKRGFFLCGFKEGVCVLVIIGSSLLVFYTNLGEKHANVCRRRGPLTDPMMVKGAIPPIAEMQSLWWISLLKNQVRKPLPPPHYHLLVKETARIKYGVDHSTYMSTLAK